MVESGIENTVTLVSKRIKYSCPTTIEKCFERNFIDSVVGIVLVRCFPRFAVHDPMMLLN